MGSTEVKMAYCHFSFRRPRGDNYGIFAACIYADEAGKRLVCRKVREYPLWMDHQHVTAIQAYEHAMRCVWEWQGQLMAHKVTDIVLVTDNSILAGWILDHKKNKEFTSWLQKAVAPYRTGGARELMVNLGLAEPRASEKSYKYCKPELVENRSERRKSNQRSGRYKLDPSDVHVTMVADLVQDLEVKGAELPIASLKQA